MDNPTTKRASSFVSYGRKGLDWLKKFKEKTTNDRNHKGNKTTQEVL